MSKSVQLWPEFGYITKRFKKIDYLYSICIYTNVLLLFQVSTYYATFVPCCFAPSALNYETAWVFRYLILLHDNLFLENWLYFPVKLQCVYIFFRHGLCVLAGGGILYVVQIFPSSYIHMLHRTAVKLGQWTKVEGRISHAFYNQ